MQIINLSLSFCNVISLDVGEEFGYRMSALLISSLIEFRVRIKSFTFHSRCKASLEKKMQ